MSASRIDAAHMRGMSTPRNRQPSGQPVGGQFAEKVQATSGVSLSDTSPHNPLESPSMRAAMTQIGHRNDLIEMLQEQSRADTARLSAAAIREKVAGARSMEVGAVSEYRGYDSYPEVDAVESVDGTEIPGGAEAAQEIIDQLITEGADPETWPETNGPEELAADWPDDPYAASVTRGPHDVSTIAVSSPVEMIGARDGHAPAWPIGIAEPETDTFYSDGVVVTQARFNFDGVDYVAEGFGTEHTGFNIDVDPADPDDKDATTLDDVAHNQVTAWMGAVHKANHDQVSDAAAGLLVDPAFKSETLRLATGNK